MTNKEAAWHLGTYSTTMGSGQTTDEQHNEAKRIAIKALEREPILDKIRAEIEATPTEIWNEDKMTYILAGYFKKQVLQIIDKYK